MRSEFRPLRSTTQLQSAWADCDRTNLTFECGGVSPHSLFSQSRSRRSRHARAVPPANAPPSSTPHARPRSRRRFFVFVSRQRGGHSLSKHIIHGRHGPSIGSTTSCATAFMTAPRFSACCRDTSCSSGSTAIPRLRSHGDRGFFRTIPRSTRATSAAASRSQTQAR